MLSSYGTVRKSRRATNSSWGAVRDALARQHAKYLKQRLSQEESGSQRDGHTAVPSLKELSCRQLQFNLQQQPGYIHMDPRLKDMLTSFQEDDSDDSDENVNEEVISEFFKSALIDDKQGMDRKALVEKVTGKLDEARDITPKFPLRPESKFNRKYFVFEHRDESSKANPLIHTSINNKTPEFELETGQITKPQETSSSPQVTLDTGYDNPNNRSSEGVKVEKGGFPRDTPMIQPLTFKLQKDQSQEKLLEKTSFCAPVSLDTGKDNTVNSLGEFFKNSSKARDLVPKIYTTLECVLDIGLALRSKEASLTPTDSLDTGYNHPDGNAERLKTKKNDCSKLKDQVLVFGPEKEKLPEFVLDVEQASTIPETSLSPPVALNTKNGNPDQEKYKEIAEDDKICSSATEGIPDLRQNPILESKEESSSSDFTLSKDSKTNMDFSDANVGPETKFDSEKVESAKPDAQPAPEKGSSILALPETPENEDTKDQDLAEDTNLPIEDDTSPKQALEAPKTIETKPQADSEETRSQKKKIDFEWQVSIQAATIEARKSQYQASLDKCNESRESVAKAKLTDKKATIPGAIAKQKLASRWEKVLVPQTSEQKPKDTDVKYTGTCQRKKLASEYNRPGIERETLEKPASLNSTKEQQVSSTICNLEQNAFHQHEMTSLDSKKEHRIVSGQEKGGVPSLQHRISEYKRNLDLDSNRVTRTVIASKIEPGVINLQERVKMYNRSISPNEQNTGSSEQLIKAASGVQGSPGSAKNSGGYKLAYEASLRGVQESPRSGSISSDDNAAVRRERRKALEHRWLCHNEKTTAEKESFQLGEKNTLADNMRHQKPFSETTPGQEEQKLVSENDTGEKKTDLIDENDSQCGIEERESINGKPNVQMERDCVAIPNEEQATTDLGFNKCKESETEKKGSTENEQAELSGTRSEASTVDKTVEKKTSSPRSATLAEEQSKSSKKGEVKTWNSILKQTNEAESIEDIAQHRRVSLQERLFSYKENAKQLQDSAKAIKRAEREIFSPGKENALYGANGPENGTKEMELERSNGEYGTSTMHDDVIQGKSGMSAEESRNFASGNAGQGTSLLPHSWSKDRIEVGQGTPTPPETIISTRPKDKAEFVNSEFSKDENGRTVISSLTLGSKEGSRASEITTGRKGTSTLPVRRDLSRRINKVPSISGTSKVGQGIPTSQDSPQKDNNKVGYGTSTLPDSPDIDNNKVGHGTSTLPDSHEKEKDRHGTSTLPDSQDKDNNKVGHGTSTLPDSPDKDNKKVGHGTSTLPDIPNKDNKKVGHGTSTLPDSPNIDNKKVGHGTSTLPDSPYKDNNKVGYETSTLPDSPDKDNYKIGHTTSTFTDSLNKDNSKIGNETSTLPDSPNIDNKKVGHGTSTLPDIPNKDNKKVGHGTSTLPDSPNKDNKKVGYGTSTLLDPPNKDNKKAGYETSTLPDSPDKDNYKIRHSTSTLTGSLNKDNSKIGHETSILPTRSRSIKPRSKVELMNPEFFQERLTRSRSSPSTNSPRQREKNEPQISDLKSGGHRTFTLPAKNICNTTEKASSLFERSSERVCEKSLERSKTRQEEFILQRNGDQANCIGSNDLHKEPSKRGHETSFLPDKTRYSRWESDLIQNLDNSTVGHGTSLSVAKTSTRSCINEMAVNLEQRKERKRTSPLPEKTALPRWRDFNPLNSVLSKQRDSTIIVQEQNDPAVNGSKDKTLYPEVSRNEHEQTALQTKSLLSFWKAKEALNMDERKASTFLEKRISSRLNNELHMNILARRTSILSDINKIPNKMSLEKSKDSPARPIFAGTVTSPTNRNKSPKMGEKDNDRKSPTSPYRTVLESTYDQGTAILPGKTGICSLRNKNSPNSGLSKDGHGTSTLLEKIRSPKMNRGGLKSDRTLDGQETSILRAKSSPRLGDIQKPSNSNVKQNVRGAFAENYGHGTSIARRACSPVKWRAGQNQSIDGSKNSVLPEDRSKLGRKDIPVPHFENNLQTEMAGSSFPRKTKSSSLMGKFTNNTPTLQERISQFRRSSGDQSCVRPSPTGNEEKPETMTTISKRRQLESSSLSVGHQLQQQNHKDKKAGRNDEKVDSKISKFEKDSASVPAEGSLSNFNTVTSASDGFGMDTSVYPLPTFQRTDVPANRYRKASGLAYFQPNVSLNKRTLPPTETATPLYKIPSEKQSTKIDSCTRNESTGLLSDLRPKNVPNMDATITIISLVDKLVAVEGTETVCPSKADAQVIHSPGPNTTEQEVVPTNVESGIPEKNTQSPKPIRNDVLTSAVGVDITETAKSCPKLTEQEPIPDHVEVTIPETTDSPPNEVERDIVSRNLDVNIFELTNLCSNPTTQEIVPSKREDSIQETTNPTEEDVIPSKIEVSTLEATKSWSEHTDNEVSPTKLEDNIPEIIDSCANFIKSEDVPTDTSEVNSKSNTETVDSVPQSDTDVLPKDSSGQVSSSDAETESIQKFSSCQSQEVDVTVRAEERRQKTDAVSRQTVHDEEDCFFNCIESDEEDCENNRSKVDAPFNYRQLSSFQRQIEQTNTLMRTVFKYFCLLLLIVGFLLPIFYQYGHLILPPEPEPEPEPSILWNILSFLLSMA